MSSEGQVPGPGRRRSRRATDAAAVIGVVHSAATVYWASGGTWLLWTLGSRVVETFSDRLWLLWPGVLVKLALAIVPAVLVRLCWPAPRAPQMLMWAASVVLIVWGGLNTVVGNLVLAGVIRPGGGYDRNAMIGHAWLWDPLFLVWGVALACALRSARPRGHAQRSVTRSTS